MDGVERVTGNAFRTILSDDVLTTFCKTNDELVLYLDDACESRYWAYAGDQLVADVFQRVVKIVRVVHMLISFLSCL